MKIWNHRKTEETISDLERNLFFNTVDNILQYLPEEDIGKIRFSREFVNEIVHYNKREDNKILLGPMDIKTLEILIFSILMKYENHNSI